MSDTITLRPDELEMIEIYRQHGDVELLARFLHQQSCIRRGMFNPWNGGHTNRAYWRRRARFIDGADK